MRRAWSSVGTCALSKLLSRHKLLVSDQVLFSRSASVVGRRLWLGIRCDSFRLDFLRELLVSTELLV